MWKVVNVICSGMDILLYPKTIYDGSTFATRTGNIIKMELSTCEAQSFCHVLVKQSFAIGHMWNVVTFIGAGMDMLVYPTKTYDGSARWYVYAVRVPYRQPGDTQTELDPNQVQR